MDNEDTATAAGVFDDSDDEQQPAPAKPAPQEAPKSKSAKLAELANKKRREMVRACSLYLDLVFDLQQYSQTGLNSVASCCA